MKTTQRKYKPGAVSLYVVIFTTLLISVITVSFLRIMISEQAQTTNNDLSQSAYDSALGGTEDAKSILVQYQVCINEGLLDIAPTATNEAAIKCHAVHDAIAGGTCDTVANASLALWGTPGSGSETQIGTADMNQAYTCVVIEPDTDDFVGELNTGKSKLIPLRFTNNAGVTQLRINWYTQVNNQGDGSLDGLGTAADDLTFPQVRNWNLNKPSVLRAQLIQTSSSFYLSDLSMNADGDRTNRATMFFYPVSGGTSTRLEASAVANTATMTSQTPFPVVCRATFTNDKYACSVTIVLPDPIGGSRIAATSFLRLTSFYKTTDFQVIALDIDGNTIQFNGVQPAIDSTGRASNLFRRVISRVEMTDVDFPYPEFAVEMNGDSPFCKAMLITDDASETIDESPAGSRCYE